MAQRLSAHLRTPASVFLVTLLIAGLGAAPAARAASPDIVISQVYGGGGNTGATLRQDFIELFNHGNATVSLTGWSVQYASSAGSTWQRTNLAGTLQPGQYYLIQQAAGTGGTVNLPTPDATGTIAMSATSGKVALVTHQTNLTCGGAPNCLPNAAIRDFVGYGSAADNFEGSGRTGTLSNTTAALRRSAGCDDSDDNAADFVVGAPSPRNTAALFHVCSNEPVLADCDGPLVTEAGTAASTQVSARDADGTVVDLAITAVVPANPQIGLTNLAPALVVGGTATADVEVSATAAVGTYQVQVTATNSDIPTPQTGLCTLSVTVTPPAKAIYEIQGSGSTSPFAGQQVTTTGVVTVILGSGFFLQDPLGDGDDATSDGLFVFTGSATARTLAPGDEVRVSGPVVEFRPASRPRDLTLTEITTPVTVIKTGNVLPLPAPVPLSDRPDVTIDPDGIDAFERLEGMLVAIERPTVVGPTNSFGELVVVAAGDLASLTPAGNILVRPAGPGAVDYNPERIMVDDEARLPGGSGSGVRVNNPQAQVIVGAVATADVVGAMDYQFSNYRVQASHRVADVLAGSVPTSPIGGLRSPQPYEGRIATFNVENLFDCVDAPGKDDTHPSCSAANRAALEIQLAKLAAAFEGELGSPELAIVEETENTAVLTGDASGFVPGTTIPALLPRVAGNFDAVSFDASDVRGIEVGFIFNTDRVTLHDAFLATDLLPDSGGLFDGSVFRAGREPLVGLFTIDDIDLVVVGNHFKSKGGPQFAGNPDDSGDDPLYGAFQPPTRWTEGLRHQQADYVRTLVDLLLASYPGVALAVGGDLNDFAFAEPGEGAGTVARIAASPSDPLTNVVDLVAEASRYTFLFEGNSQVLDHLLINAPLAARLTGQGIAHFNASFPNVFGSNPAVTFRASDHDPLVAYLCTDATPPALAVSVSPSRLWPPHHQLVTVTAEVQVSDNGDPGVAATLVSVTSSEPDDGLGDGDTAGDVTIVNDRTFRLRAERSGLGGGRVYTITYAATDACGNTATASATVTVPHSLGTP